ncbi:MAG: type II toxin-antitoxin system RelE/ParE family toxin [Tatlockia sp.]|nr:type II toxin-antitoxin system RelE/ParE family toxin [Tatlockia sp.]
MNLFLSIEIKKWFDNENDISNENLRNAAKEITEGIYEANLGGHLYKKRISNSSSKGKSAGSRLIIAYKKGSDIFFMYAFNKNERSTITNKERMALKARAKFILEWVKKKLKTPFPPKYFTG